jgi:hypothetical protein
VHELTLVRATDARTRGGLSCLDCPHCGGPLAESDDASCGYCGALLTGGIDEWALWSVRPVT